MTTYATIIAAGLDRSLLNDHGQTELASDTAELVGFLSRVVRSLYTLAGLPQPEGMSRGHYFARTQTGTVATPATTFTALPASPEFVYVFSVTETSGGAPVAVVSLADVREGLAETPPAIIIADQQFRSAGRTGDPTAGASLTFDGTYLPPEATLSSDYVGATTPATASTSTWPGHVGDPFLIAQLARYLALKDASRSADELAAYDAEIAQAAQLLGSVIGVAPARLTAVRPT